MSVSAICLDDRPAWERALDDVPHAFAHTWGHSHAMQVNSGLRTFLWCHDDGDVRVRCPVVERPIDDSAVDVVTPFGFSGFVGNGPCRDLQRIWREWCRSRGYVCGYIGTNPILLDPTYVQGDDAFPGPLLFVLDLRKDEEALQGSLHESLRRKHRHMPDTVISNGSPDGPLGRFFVDHYETCFRSRQAAGAYRLSRPALAALLGARDTFLIGVRRHEVVESVTLVGYSKDCGDAMLNVCTDIGREHAFTLLWNAALHLKALGVPFMNLGGGIREGDGVAAFKRRFGGDERRAVALKQVYDEKRYRALCERAAVDPDARSGYFPPYRAAVVAE